jgi:tetratricopeptide (TPR) repeat protein
MRILLIFLFSIPLLGVGQSTLEKGKNLLQNKKYQEAKKLLSSIDESEKDFATAQYYLGRSAFEQKEFDDAADYFESATEADKKNSEYFQWLGDTYGIIARDANVVRQGFLAPKMKSAWETAVALDPKNINARLSLIEYYMQAPSIMGGSPDKAKEVARQIIKLNPAQGYRAQGNIYMREKNLSAAEKSYLEMVKADEALIPALGNFYLTNNQYDKAFKLLEDAVKKNPSDMGSVYQLGKTSALSGKQLERGEQCLRQYLDYQPKSNEPSHAGAQMRLAQILEKRGNKPEAKKLYEAALKKDNSLQEAKDGLERVSK